MRNRIPGLLSLLLLLIMSSNVMAESVRLEASDTPMDAGTSLEVKAIIDLPMMETDQLKQWTAFLIQYSEEPGGLGKEFARQPFEYIAPESASDGQTQLVPLNIEAVARDLHKKRPYYFSLMAETEEGELIRLAETTGSVTPQLNSFDGSKTTLFVVLAGVCGSVILFVLLARGGAILHIRPIAGLQAVDEAVGRATEMGRSCLFIPGIQDMNDMQTIAGINILSRVAKVAAEYDCDVEVPTSRSLVMTAAAETVQSAFLLAGRPDGFNPDLIYYVTDEQFGFVAYLTGKMVREEPAACFYLGSFYAESLILAETGNAVGAIQVAGTAQPSQLPFFVAACDYTLIGEELFAASAYLSGSPEELGSLKGQDIGKILGALAMLIGSIWATISVLQSSVEPESTVASLGQVLVSLIW